MIMDHERFNYWKTQNFQSHGVYHEWFIRDRKTKNGAHFHGRVSKFDQTSGLSEANRHGFWPMGLEIHSVAPMYEGQMPIKDCRVTGGDCYCDGTSLGAHERLGSVNPDGSDDQKIWNVLHSFYHSHFDAPKEDGTE